MFFCAYFSNKHAFILFSNSLIPIFFVLETFMISCQKNWFFA